MLTKNEQLLTELRDALIDKCGMPDGLYTADQLAAGITDGVAAQLAIHATPDLLYSTAQPLVQETDTMYGAATIHTVYEDAVVRIKATNLHATDGFDMRQLEVLEEEHGMCFRMKNTDVHFFVATDGSSAGAMATLQGWISERPPLDAVMLRLSSVNEVYSTGYANGRPDSPLQVRGQYHAPAVDHRKAWINVDAPVVQGCSGGDLRALTSGFVNPMPLGINVGMSYGDFGGKTKHWLCIVPWHSEMKVSVAT